MSKVLYIILISLFSLTVISCRSSDSGSSATTQDNSYPPGPKGRGFVAVGHSGTVIKSIDHGSSFEKIIIQEYNFEEETWGIFTPVSMESLSETIALWDLLILETC